MRFSDHVVERAILQGGLADNGLTAERIVYCCVLVLLQDPLLVAVELSARLSQGILQVAAHVPLVVGVLIFRELVGPLPHLRSTVLRQHLSFLDLLLNGFVDQLKRIV